MERKSKQVNSSSGVSFSVRFLFRQNATCQGELYWVEAGKTVRFRSIMEMVTLMHEAMDKTGKPTVEYDLRNWGGNNNLKQSVAGEIN